MKTYTTNKMNTPRSDFTDKQRFLNKIIKTTDKNSCWLYSGYKSKGGYCQFWSNGKTVLAHRYSYELHKNKIPSGLVIDHLCKTRNCVNPKHMEVVTLEENSLRGITSQNNLKKEVCLRGHIFSEENTYIHKTTKERVCRKCKALHQKEYQNKNYGKKQ